MKDSTRRGLRTVLQMIVTVLTTGSGTALLQLFGVDVTPQQWAVVSTALLPLVTIVLNELEDSGKIPALLKAPASDGEDPVP